MLKWFRPKRECPIEPAMRDWIDQRWQWLLDQFGREQLRGTEVILPRAQYFPDPYQRTGEDVRRMLDRVCGYMRIDPEIVELSFYEDRNPAHEGRWRQGTAGLYHPDGGVFRIWVETANLDNPVALVATMAHELGHVHLLGHGRITDEAEDHELLTDLLTVFLGMGVFTANSVVHEHYWHGGVVSGWSIGRQGYMRMPEYGYAFAHFARSREEDGLAWAKELRLDVRSAFHQSMRYLAGG